MQIQWKLRQKHFLRHEKAPLLDTKWPKIDSNGLKVTQNANKLMQIQIKLQQHHAKINKTAVPESQILNATEQFNVFLFFCRLPPLLIILGCFLFIQQLCLFKKWFFSCSVGTWDQFIICIYFRWCFSSLGYNKIK